jgi:phosphoribosylglycinamide formyltransferase 1
LKFNWKIRNRWCVFISGTGSNLGALLDRRPEVDIGLVVSSNPQAYGLVRARRAGVPVWVMPRPTDWNQVTNTLRDSNIDWIFLAGFMKLLPPEFVEQWSGKIINVHPSLLPNYPGLKSIEKAYEAKHPLGVTVHHVIAEVDAGPQILQRRVDVEGASNLEQARFMIHVNEHRLVREGAIRCKHVAI